MRPLVLCSLLAALAPGASLAQDKPAAPSKPPQVKNVPTLPRAPKLDGDLKDFPATLTLKPPPSLEASASFTARVGWYKDTLYVGVDATDDQVQAADALTLTLFFPDAGPVATGHVFRFGFDGKRPPPADSPTPELAQKLVDVGVQHKNNRLTLELAIPSKALPRMPAQDPLTFELCLSYEDVDAAGASTQSVSNCKGGSMVGEVLRLPDEVRKNLKLKLPPSVVALEPRADGWLGYDMFHYPAWVEADKSLTPALLETLVVPHVVRAEEVGVNVPETLSLPKGVPVVVVLSGETPYQQGTCEPDKELRMGLYTVKGKTAQRVLEWPAATCGLGRATSMEINEEGTLNIGYSNGAIVNFAWSGDHFERTELGKR